MFSRKFIIKPFKWTVTVVYDVTCNDVESLKNYSYILTDNNVCGRIYSRLKTCGNKTGFTCTDSDTGESVVLIGKSEEFNETLNTIVHETSHVAVHLATLFNIDMKSEDFCEITGYIGEKMLCFWLESKNVFIQETNDI